MSHYVFYLCMILLYLYRALKLLRVAIDVMGLSAKTIFRLVVVEMVTNDL
jgi:hypothetical protein